MPHCFLHSSQVGALFRHMRAECMAQPIDAGSLDSCLVKIFIHQPFYASRGN